jgi:hypothetical protein
MLSGIQNHGVTHVHQIITQRVQAVYIYLDFFLEIIQNKQYMAKLRTYMPVAARSVKNRGCPVPVLMI